VVPIESTLEIKTRVSHRPITVEVLPQLWISQTPNPVRAYHKNGLFQPPRVENLTPEIRKWEEGHQPDLSTLAMVMKKIIKVVRESGGSATIKYDDQTDKLVIWKAEGKTILPDDLYSRIDHTNSAKVDLFANLNKTTESRSSKTTVKVGDILFDIDSA
jgi:hypothetical protein